MKKTPTLLMKELKYYHEEVNRLYSEDQERSSAPINEKNEYKYETGYSYENNRREIERIHEEELKIKSALAKFNAVTKVDGLDMTISEALVKIAQLKEDIKVLMPLANRAEVFRKNDDFRSSAETYKITYNQAKVRDDLRKLQKELTTIQMAVDRINLTALVEY